MLIAPGADQTLDVVLDEQREDGLGDDLGKSSSPCFCKGSRQGGSYIGAGPCLKSPNSTVSDALMATPATPPAWG